MNSHRTLATTFALQLFSLACLHADDTATASVKTTFNSEFTPEADPNDRLCAIAPRKTTGQMDYSYIGEYDASRERVIA